MHSRWVEEGEQHPGVAEGQERGDAQSGGLVEKGRSEGFCHDNFHHKLFHPWPHLREQC